MATSVEQAITKSVRALSTRDTALAQEVITADSDIDADENEVDDSCAKMLALHQPVAVDLRRIIAGLQISHELERMADRAVAIAGRVLDLAGSSPLPVPEQLQPMTDLATTMVRHSIAAFVAQDAQLARTTCRLDDQVDRLQEQIIDGLITQMKTSPELVKPGLSLFSTVRHLERIADHAASIAEDVVYLVEGEIIRHRPITQLER